MKKFIALIIASAGLLNSVYASDTGYGNQERTFDFESNVNLVARNLVKSTITKDTFFAESLLFIRGIKLDQSQNVRSTTQDEPKFDGLKIADSTEEVKAD